MTVTNDNLTAADHAEQKFREDRLEQWERESIRDGRVLCAGCEESRPVDMMDFCDFCGRKFCTQCLAPATDPIGGQKYVGACATCRERIREVEVALEFWRMRDTIEALVNEYGALLADIRKEG